MPLEDHDQKSLISSTSRQQFHLQTTKNHTHHRICQRAIAKTGKCNIHFYNIKKKIRYLHDIFTSIIDLRWRFTLLSYFLAYFISWLFFSLIWWLIIFTHGDLAEENLPQNQAESSWTPCVLNIHNFTSCYLFSVETQFTVGYGVRTITEECPQAIFILSMQAFSGMFIDCFFLGIVFAKLTRPKRRTKTIMFSKNMVVCQQDAKLVLMFRIGDMRGNPLAGSNIRALLLKPRITKEGEVLETFMSEIDLKIDGGGSGVLLLWPMTVSHRIDENSPFYHFSPGQLQREERFEIVVFLEATAESTGQGIQARSSYVGSDILWGYKFEPVVDHLRNDKTYEVVYSKFNSVYESETPFCSAAELESFMGSQGEDDGRVPPVPVRRSFAGRRVAGNEAFPRPLIDFASSYV